MGAGAQPRESMSAVDPADQREFLLRSLEDLELEHEAGDLDDADYNALKDEYTARAAAALRAEPAAATPRPPREPRMAGPRRGARLRRPGWSAGGSGVGSA